MITRTWLANTAGTKAKDKWKTIGCQAGKRQPTEASEVESETNAHTGVDCARANHNQQGTGYFLRRPPRPVLPAVFPETAD